MLRLPRLLLLVFACASMALTACGKPNEKDLCEGVTCDGGVCDSDSGECVNPGTCDETTTCLEGYECQLETCVAAFACSEDGECDRGTCVDGACQNPDRCDVDTDCVPGYACDGDACIEDKCDLVECDRGVCDQNTGECVNSAVCTAGSQEEDCVDGFVCYNQTCADEMTVCEELECGRGVCSFVDLACINAEDCGGDDMNCLEGSFCNAVNQCQQNVCDNNGTTCARGVCEPSTGDCVNADSCAANSECTDGFYCIEGTCTDQNDACDTCPGNQICEYDEPSLTVACQESPRGCRTSIDCVGDRECSNGQCGAAVPCSPDALEPNNSQGAATDWFTVAPSVSASACPGDQDHYAFDVSQDPQFTGSLKALITIAPSDIGVGTLELELLDSNGAVVASNTSAANAATVELAYSIGNINQGTYTLRVSPGSVSAGGIDYSLVMDLVDNATDAMCTAAALLEGTVSGDTSNSTSNSLGSACAADPSGIEEAWVLEITEPTFVTIDLQGNLFDAVLSLRQHCSADASEIACADNGSGSSGETISRLLDPGTYSVVVQGATASERGVYALQLTRSAVICTNTDNTCVDANTSSQCNANGTAFENVACRNGCDSSTGSCLRDAGDICTTAIGAINGYAGSMNLGLLEADFTPGSACTLATPALANAATGDDAVFTVSIAAGEVLTAVATPSSSLVDVSWYLQDGCEFGTPTCITGVNAVGSGAETLNYFNDTGATQDLYLVLDTNTTTSTTSVDVAISTATRICTPAATQCAGGGTSLETCNAAGTAWSGVSCTFGCDTANPACFPPPNELCDAGAIDVSGGGTFSGSIGEYANDYSATSACTNFSSNGRDAAFVLTGTPGDVVTATVVSSFDSSIYAVGDCNDIANTCLDGEDNGGDEVAQFVIPDTNPVFIVVDAFSASSTSDFTLTVDVQTPDCSNYNESVTCTDADTVQYCDSLGFFQDYDCATTCTAGACDQPSGDFCFDAIPVSSGDNVTGNFSGFNNNIDPPIGTCLLNPSNDQPGRDVVYSIDLLSGDLLDVELTTSSSGAGMYILSNCDARTSCEWAAPASKELTFFAETTGTYYVVIDSLYTGSVSDYEVDFNVTSGFVCQPGGSKCELGTLTLCNIDGTSIQNTLTCANGCASNIACAAPTAVNDTCATAQTLTGSVRYLDNWDRYTNTLDPGVTTGNSCSISSFNSDGPEAVYQVTLGAGQVVDVTVDDLGATGSPTVYISRDCTDPETTCVATDTSAVARAGYVSQLGETVFVTVDNSSNTVTGSFLMDIDIRASQCAPTLNDCADAFTRQWCDEFGIIQQEECYFGCTTGACNAPTNNSCTAPLDLGVGGSSVTIPWAGYTNDYGSTTIPCAGTSASGEDAVFSVTGNAGDYLRATLGGADTDGVLWITTTCGDTTACLEGADDTFTGTDEVIELILPADGTYYIMVDDYFSATGSFDLDVQVMPPICTPGSSQCDQAGMNVEVCNGLGVDYDVFACDAAGCSAGTCVTQTGEYPAAAFDGNALGMFTGTYADFENDLVFDGPSCTGWSANGPEAAYFVDLVMGQTLTATLSGADDTSLYIMSGMSDPSESCLVGDDNTSGSETVSYTATADMRVYVIADAFTSSASGAFTLNLSVQ